MGTVASLDIDAQKGFTPLCPNELPVAGGDDIVAALNAQATLASLRIGSKDAHPANAVWVASEPATMLQPLDFPNADLTWPVHCVPGSKGFELLDGLPEFTGMEVPPGFQQPFGDALLRVQGGFKPLSQRGHSRVRSFGWSNPFCGRLKWVEGSKRSG